MQHLPIHRFVALALLAIVISIHSSAQKGVIISTNSDQENLLRTYRFTLEQSENDYRGGTATDNNLFPSFGESSFYRILSGTNAGGIVFADSLPPDYARLEATAYTNYDWTSNPHVSVQFKRHPKRIAIFKSQYKSENVSLTWESIYFERLFSEFLMDNISYTIDETTLASEGIDDETELLIIPSFLVKDEDNTYFIDSILSVTPGVKAKLDAYLSKGGNIYAEGNAAYFIEKVGYLEEGAIDYISTSGDEGTIDLQINAASDMLSLGALATDTKLYVTQLPAVSSSNITTIASNTGGNPCIFKLNANQTSGGKIHCNTGLPTVRGLSDPFAENNQLGWTLNSILSAFSSEIDITRKVSNEILYDEQNLGDNCISYDRLDTFQVDLRVRNLSNQAITVSIHEQIKNYFTFYQVLTGESYSLNGYHLTFDDISIAAHSERIISYLVITPEPDSELHEDVDQYLDEGTLMAVGTLTTQFNKDGFKTVFHKNKDYADILFSARIFADTDVNYKNFLGLFYQPFKVFMIMENKSRSAAQNTQYVQYIPKDVPFYWSDNSLNIPILKTPGGEFVDVLRGSDDEDNPEYDMDSDGDPDVWLDTTSIYPKGYTIVEDSVYWANPWNHLRTGNESFVFEDIDHDGNVAEDTDGDGIIDIEDPGDKIRVWKVTWDIGRVAGYEYYDPYCSYEIWLDPPDFIPLSAGVSYKNDSLDVADYPGMFYPYYDDINLADINDTTWSYWMERDDDGEVIWDQLIHQRINNYEGFTFVDTSEYQLLPTDSLIGTAPQPHREFIAVLSLGGEEIDMRNYTPTNSLYSKVNYETVFGEERMTPIRTTYSYWAPLPNPLQFEYLSNNYQAFDTTGAVIRELPEHGKAHLQFDMDASTEYTYYWIRNVGYDVDYNDASESIEGPTGESLGDGVFGYFIYSIPKGMGGYRITLPRKEDGSFNIDSIVQIDHQPFTKWIDNPNTWNEVEIWETPFEYQVYIPQLLIPPALDDDNFDGEDDWIDDRGDRFSSETGFLHDAFMLDDGEDYPDSPAEPFVDDIYGLVESGWDAGDDAEYGDDYFETLGKTHITIHADYEGRGREGSVEISKGGVLVCEEIFGGSPWVIFSHVLSGFATGTDLSVKSEVTPELVYYGIDTVYLKHTITDTNEPHSFNRNFDPYHISYGYGESTITTFVGAKDPCSLIEPAISMPAIVDPDYDIYEIELVPYADPTNPDLTDYPKIPNPGTFIEVRVEVGNSTDDNWINTCVKPQLSSDIGTIEMSYIAYPRPLVPSHFEGDEIVPGDQPGTFTTGWRFNQPEGEVLIRMGDTLNLLQPTRRAYFVFLVRITEALENGIYSIPFTLTGKQINYKRTDNGTISYAVPDALFSVVEKDENGRIEEYQQMVLQSAQLENLDVSITNNFESLGEIRFSNTDFDYSEFGGMTGTLPGSANNIDLSGFSNFPNVDTSNLVIMQKGIVDSYNTDAEILILSNGQILNYTDPTQGDMAVASEALVVRPIGPRIQVTNEVYSVNGLLVSDTISYEPEEDLNVVTRLTVRNTGTDISSNTIIRIDPGPYYTIVTESLDTNCTIVDGILQVDMGDLTPGLKKQQFLPFLLNAANIPEGADIRTIIDLTGINYEGTLVEAEFSFEDPDDVLLDIYDFEAISINYTDLDNGTVEVNAEAHNRGIFGNDVWFRIYPIIGGGVHEFAFAELQQAEFQPGETLELSGVYTLPETSQSISFIAIIDDGQRYTEITEVNNTITVGFQATSIENTNALTRTIQIYPQPFSDEANFDYRLTEGYSDVSIQIYSLTGDLVHRIDACTGKEGINRLSWRNSDLPEGNYLYFMTGKNTSGKTELLFKGHLVKSAR